MTPDDRQQIFLLGGLFFLSLVVYVLTMSTGITWLNTGHDGGDFISAARSFGVPHPTGYPTYTVLLRIFGDVVAIGDQAFRANLFSALMGAATVPLVYLAAKRLLGLLPVSEVGDGKAMRVSAVIAALAFATSRLFWTQATVTEVYTLNALFGAGLLVLVLGSLQELKAGAPAVRSRTIIAVLLGLGLGNHTTLGLAAAPFGVWVMWEVWNTHGWKGVFDWRPIVGLLVGLSVYVYVPIAASAAPLVSWGSPDSIEGFRWMISGALYRPYAFGLASELLSGRISTIAEMLFTQFTVIGTVIGIAGMTTIWSYSRAFVIASVASVLTIAVYAVAYDTVDSFIYLISAFMLFSLWLAVGTAVLAQGVRRFAIRTPRFASYQKQLFVGAFVIVTLVVPGWSLVSGWGEVDLSSNDEPAVFARDTIVKAAGGIVFAEEPQLFALVYQAQVENPEADVMVVGPLLLGHNWYWDQLAEYYPRRMPSERPETIQQRFDWVVGLNLGIMPLYTTHDDRYYHSSVELVEEGDLFRIEF